MRRRNFYYDGVSRFSVGKFLGNRRYSISATNYYNSGHHLYSHKFIPDIFQGRGGNGHRHIAGGSALSRLLRIFIGNLLEVGGKRFFILNKNGTPDVATILTDSSPTLREYRADNILRDLFISLWTLLLVIRRNCQVYEYLMVPYILAENPAMDRKIGFAISKRMMDGEN